MEQRNHKSEKKSNEFIQTYINPTPLPDMPIGRFAVLNNYDRGWREACDPTVLYENDKWYLFASCGMAWVSEDFCTWHHKKVQPFDCGYAPTVVNHNGIYYLCASLSQLYASDNILGPYEPVGEFRFKNGDCIGKYYDPMLFGDDDGKLYLYYCIYSSELHSTVICGAELDSENPLNFVSEPVKLISFDPSHKWECNGEHNEDTTTSAIEGPWMYKKNGTYYLIYSAPGTEYSTYALGAYKSTKPLSEFEYMKTSPFSLKTNGVVKGPGHGCIVDGPNDTVWMFYTCVLAAKHEWERMIGYDRIDFNSEGDIICREVTETPQLSPVLTGEKPNLVSLCSKRNVTATSEAPGRNAAYAVTDDLTSWWEPLNTDITPSLDISLPPLGANVCAVRIIWNEMGLSVKKNITGGPIGYILELKNKNGDYVTVVDKRNNTVMSAIEYVCFESFFAEEARLTVTSYQKGIIPAVYNISLFGNT